MEIIVGFPFFSSLCFSYGGVFVADNGIFSSGLGSFLVNAILILFGLLYLHVFVVYVVEN